MVWQMDRPRPVPSDEVVELDETLEDALLPFLWYSASRVPHVEIEHVILVKLISHCDASLACELAGVDEQVVEDLRQACRLNIYVAVCQALHAVQHHAFRHLGLHRHLYVVQQLVEVGGLVQEIQRVGLHLRQVEDIGVT